MKIKGYKGVKINSSKHDYSKDGDECFIYGELKGLFLVNFKKPQYLILVAKSKIKILEEKLLTYTDYLKDSYSTLKETFPELILFSFENTTIKLNKLSENQYEVFYNSNTTKIGEFIRIEDGFYYYDDCDIKGLISQEVLISLGEKLKELNEPYNQHLKEYFESHKDEENKGDIF